MYVAQLLQNGGDFISARQVTATTRYFGTWLFAINITSPVCIILSSSMNPPVHIALIGIRLGNDKT